MLAGIVAYVAAILLPAIHLSADPRSTLAAVPDVLARGVTVVAVFAAILAVTGFFHPEELRRLAALRRRGQPAKTTLRSPDSTEMAGEIVATDIEPPE